MAKWESFMWDYKDFRQFEDKVRKGLPPLIITAAITGGAAGKETNPYLPETPEEQADSAYEAYKAGASIIHIHARDPKKGYADASADPEDFKKVNRLVREKCPDVIVADTTGGGPGLSLEQAARSLQADPEIGSLNCGPRATKHTLKRREPPLAGRDKDIQFDGVTAISVGGTEALAREMKKRGIKPELEVYCSSMFNLADNLIRQGLVAKPYMFSLIFGGAGHVFTPLNLITTVAALPPDSVWQAIGVAWTQLPLSIMAMIMGGNIRVGFEDNTFYRRGELLKSNAQAVQRIVRIADEMGRPVATPAQAREILGLSATPQPYN